MKKALIIAAGIFVVIMIPVIVFQFQPKPIEVKPAPGVTDAPTFHSTSGVDQFFENIQIMNVELVLDEKENSKYAEISDEESYRKLSEIFKKREFRKVQENNDDGPWLSIILKYVNQGFPEQDELLVSETAIKRANHDGNYVCDDMKKLYKEILDFINECK